jgi:hypothetical protein
LERLVLADLPGTEEVREFPVFEKMSFFIDRDFEEGSNSSFQVSEEKGFI